MTTLIVPPLDLVPYPTLGPQVCDFIESYLVHGPGDLLGEPAKLDAEKRAVIYRAYEVYPQSHPQAGRRRFKRVGISWRKGSAKTEWAAWIAICELHPDGPVRCDGFDVNGEPVGCGVTDPFIPMVAFTEEQTEELAYGAVRVILEHCDLGNDFDIGLARVMRKDGNGKAAPYASSPNSADGARTTWQHFDETHRLTLPRLLQAHQTMMANIPKRYLADAWSLETTTAPAPGEGSVAEKTMDYAQQVADGKIKDSKLFFFHRQASDGYDLTDKAQIRQAVLEASGPIAEWSDIDGIVDQWEDPTADRSYLERVWLNRLVRGSDRAFDAGKWKALVHEDAEWCKQGPPQGEMITLGFDGSRYNDATALIATHISSAFQWVIGIWERPYNAPDSWEVPEAEVEEALKMAFQRWDVWRLYADPPYWETHVAKWAGEYGEDRVYQFRTNNTAKMAAAIRAYDNAIKSGELAHDGNAAFARHIGNACRRMLTLRDEKGEHLWTIYKERPDSPHKIDASMAAALSWEARNTAVANGIGQQSVYESRGVLVLG